MTYHTKQVLCDGQTEKLTCGCEKCHACGSFIQMNATAASSSPVHVHTTVTYL
jgi:hypothetical protein